MKKQLRTADLKPGMLVSCPTFNGLRVIVEGPFALAVCHPGRYRTAGSMYRVKLADPITGIATSFDCSAGDGVNSWTLHDEDDSMPDGMVECGTYGCKDPKPKGSVFCKSCYQDYLEDPDAYK